MTTTKSITKVKSITKQNYFFIKGAKRKLLVNRVYLRDKAYKSWDMLKTCRSKNCDFQLPVRGH
jgi:hypothetical protein